MERPEGIILLAGVCLLLVIVLSTVESGRVAGANYQAALPIPFDLSGLLRYHQPNLTGTANQQGSKPNQNLTPNQQNQNPFSLFASLALLPALPDWLLPVLAIACFVGACFLILRLKTGVSVVDLEETIREMEAQQKRLAESWSYKLRNMALLRYYLLMRRACSSVGLQERPEETPKEYIERASSFLKVDDTYAAKFADAVNRCRYGEELSEEDAREASTFMGEFTDVIRRTANAP